MKVCLKYDPQWMPAIGFEANKMLYTAYLVAHKALKEIKKTGKIDEQQLDKGYAGILFSKQPV